MKLALENGCYTTWRFNTIKDGFDVLNSRCGMNEKNMIKSGYGIDVYKRQILW